MAVIVRSPLNLSGLRDNRRISLAALFGLESLSRAILLTIVPIQGMAVFGTAKTLSDMLFVASLFGLVSTLNLAALIQLIARRYVYTLGISMIAVASLLLMVETPKAYVIAVALRASGTGMITAIVSLYVMDLISKQDFTRYEPNRLLFSSASWIAGPTLGIWLSTSVGEWAPYMVSVASSMAALGYFWWLRLGPGKVIQAAKRNPVHPLLAVVHFFQRRHLRMSYIIVWVRASFWVSLFIYSPLYITKAGLDDIYAGLFLSGVNSIIFLAPIIGMGARILGVRKTIISGFALLTLALLGLGLVGSPKPIGLVFWVMAALFAFCLDVVANVPFMRLVKESERADMTMVFTTWRDLAEVTAPGLAGFVLAVAPIQGLFFALAGMMAGTTYLATWLPRRL